MIQKKIVFKKTDDVINFVNKIQQFDFDVKLIHDNVIVNAKSLFGVMSISQQSGLQVRAEEDNQEFLEFVEEYAMTE